MTKKTIKMKLSCLFLVMLFSVMILPFNVRVINAESGNNYPIIFVHGLFGWGKGDLSTNYWGGKNDILQDLNNKGFNAMDATIGSVSSNWDRACELYYYIKGGTVDYGEAHSKKYDHERYGSTFDGIYPEWDETSKIHLIGHSYGGETIRLLVELLKNGDKEERGYHGSGGISQLFEGGKNWVNSITTIATPLNGATFANFVDKNAFGIESLFFASGAILGSNFDKYLFDLRLDQWGIKKENSNSMSDYIADIQNSEVLGSDDYALLDLTTDGAKRLNNITKTYPDIYYFSYSGDNSIRNPFNGYYLPKQISYGSISAIVTGMYKQNNELPQGDKAWWKNDGTVSVISAQYPFGQAHKDSNGVNEKGIWIVNPTMNNWGHGDFIGVGRQSYSNVLNLYVKISTTLQKLSK